MIKRKTKFYQFSQNNSGGTFTFDKKRGITHGVIVEAHTANEANDIAERIGLYWDGCESGLDCACCGDRWYTADDRDACDYPHWYGTKLLDKVSLSSDMRFMDKGKEIAVHYLDGTIKWW